MSYFTKRLILLPLTLFAILILNFVIINLAPGEPSSRAQRSASGEAVRQEGVSYGEEGDDAYLNFRERYGLTLPIVFNHWIFESEQQILKKLKKLIAHHEQVLEGKGSFTQYFALKRELGDQAKYCMPQLLALAAQEKDNPPMLALISKLLIRGATLQGHIGISLSAEQKEKNRQFAKQNKLTSGWDLSKNFKDYEQWQAWLKEPEVAMRFFVNASKKTQLQVCLTHTRLASYLARISTLDFGTLRKDSTKTVTSEVIKRLPISITLAVVPMLLTFFFCQVFGTLMAFYHNRWPDYLLNLLFLVLYATPVFVVAPFLIEHVALPNPHIPLGGFQSPPGEWELLNSYEKLKDLLLHLFLPFTAIFYGGMAAQTRLARTAVLEVLHQDYIKAAKARGVRFTSLIINYVLRNASITLVTSIAGSLGVILGGSLIVETLFEIDGFGRFFYQAILERDYNVMMFSAIISSFLTLVGYLLADLAYTLLDPRVRFE